MTEQFDLSRADRIRQHSAFVREYERLQRMEQGRVFCGHTMEHFLDVARACWILCLERGLGLEKDVVYAAGLLHDIGKGVQYESGTPHQEAGAQLAGEIMPACGYTEEETAVVTQAIRHHRAPTDGAAPLVALLYEADKRTRLCFACPASADCNWPEEKKTKSLLI